MAPQNWSTGQSGSNRCNYLILLMFSLHQIGPQKLGGPVNIGQIAILGVFYIQVL